MKNTTIILTSVLMFASITQLVSQQRSKNDIREVLKRNAAKESAQLQKAVGDDYSFTVETGVYTDLVGSTSVNNNEVWDDPEFVVPIGFSFRLYDKDITSLYFGLGLGALISSELNQNFEADYLIIPFETDLIDRGDFTGSSQSPISYRLEGTPGSRIFKLEWKNAGFYDEGFENGTYNDFVNIQLWLFEGSNNIQFRYGPNRITNPSINYFGETGAFIGVTDFDLANAYLLDGPVNNPRLVEFLVSINGTPSSGTIYNFIKNNATGIEGQTDSMLKIQAFPNPSSAVFNVQGLSKPIHFHITDVKGKNIQNGVLSAQSSEIDLSEQFNGMYFLHIGGQIIKLIKHQ